MFAGSKEAEATFSAAPPASLGNGTLNYGQSALSGAGFIGTLPAETSDKATELSLKFGSFGISSPSNGAPANSEVVSHESSQMGMAQPSAMPHMNYMPGAGIAATQYGAGFQYGGVFGGAANAAMPGTRPGMAHAGMYGVEDMQYGAAEYGSPVEPTKGGEASASSRNYNNSRRGQGGYSNDSKGSGGKHSSQQPSQQQQQPSQQQPLSQPQQQQQQQQPPPHPQQQMPPQHQAQQQAMQAGQHMPYAYQQMGYAQYAPVYPQAAFYGGYQGYPQATAQYNQQPNKMRPGAHASMPQYSFPAQGGGYTSYMGAAPATMGYDNYASYSDGSYPVQQQEAAPASSGAASAGTGDSKQTAEIQQLAAGGFQHYAGAGGYQPNYYAGGYAAPQSAHMQQTAATMQQPAYGQPYGGWQGGTPSQGGTR